MYDSHRILDRDKLRASRLQVPVRTSQTRQNQRPLASNQVAPVQLGGNLHGQTATRQSPCREFGVWCSRQKISTHGEEHLRFTTMHRPDRLHHIPPRLARWFESERIAQFIEEALR